MFGIAQLNEHVQTGLLAPLKMDEPLIPKVMRSSTAKGIYNELVQCVSSLKKKDQPLYK